MKPINLNENFTYQYSFVKSHHWIRKSDRTEISIVDIHKMGYSIEQFFSLPLNDINNKISQMLIEKAEDAIKPKKKLKLDEDKFEQQMRNIWHIDEK